MPVGTDGTDARPRRLGPPFEPCSSYQNTYLDCFLCRTQREILKRAGKRAASPARVAAFGGDAHFGGNETRPEYPCLSVSHARRLRGGWRWGLTRSASFREVASGRADACTSAQPEKTRARVTPRAEAGHRQHGTKRRGDARF